MTSLSDYLELAAGVVLVCGAGIGLVFYRKQPNKISTKVIQSAGACASPATAERQRPKNQLQIRSAEALFAMTETQGLVETIRTRMGLSPDNFKKDVLPALSQFAEYVQLIPASESHHHAQPGGLLQHTLEVAANALALREGYKLPTGAAPEEQIQRAPVWSFGILVAALLHDVGKPVADVLTIQQRVVAVGMAWWVLCERKRFPLMQTSTPCSSPTKRTTKHINAYQ